MMKDWAENEVRIACEHEKANNTNATDFDYGCACYKSALKAFKSLLEDNHSGMSIIFTKNILNRLIDGKPLTPIEDTEDTWDYISEDKFGKKMYQCKRMSSLFKYVCKNNQIIYNDVDRFICIDINDSNKVYRFGLVDNVMRNILPIKMPYIPLNNSIKIYCEDILYDKTSGEDFDTFAVIKAILPSGEIMDINKYFKEDKGQFIDISFEEYCIRKNSRKDDINDNKNN